ncbi:MAG: reverse transcriptase domain-containing protein, partial [Candidatus Thiodiazotropha sp.]
MDCLTQVKRVELEVFINENSPDIIGLTEIFPKQYSYELDQSTFQIDNYDMFCSPIGQGRGVVIYVKNALFANSVTFDTNFKESVWCKIQLRQASTLLMGCIYRSPSSTQENSEHLLSLLRNVRQEKYSHILIMGDFNHKEINWIDNSTIVGENHIASIFLECIRDTFLFQHVKEPTRIRENNEPSTLDLIFTNEENMVNTLNYYPGLGKSDHLVLVYNYICFTENEQDCTDKKLNYFKGDYPAISKSLEEIEWATVFSGLDLSQSWLFFAEKLVELSEKHIPVSKAREGRNKNNPYVTRSALEAIKKKHTKWLKYKYCKTAENYGNYKKARNIVTTELRRGKYFYEKDLTARIKNENKLFWGYVRSKTKTKATVSKLTNDEGNFSESNQETAEILNKFFASVFVTEGDEDLPVFDQRNYIQPLETVNITEDLVSKAIDRLNPTKSQGPDCIHPKVLKEIQIVKKPLKIIFEKSLQEAKIPDIWKKANVTAIFKKGERNKAENYRPISLTSVPGKLMERLVRNAIVDHMTVNNLFSVSQHGFISGKSCITQLLEFLEDITEEIDNGKDVDIIYLDFCKAFDKVAHQRLLKKIEKYGIIGKLHAWIKDFLSNRQQRVVIKGSTSDWTDITSGIPQGSVLGPILFLIYINDLPGAINGLMKIFADDAKIYYAVDSRDTPFLLQEDISRAEQWAEDWKMSFNFNKCHHLHVGEADEVFRYNMGTGDNKTEIERVKSEKDLGVTIDEKLKFREHITQKVNIANRNLGIIFRTFMFMDKEMFLNLYKSMVRPHLEYATQIWSPKYKKDKIIIENVQRRATRLLKCIQHLPYHERLKKLGLPTLEYRRERADMVQVYKILHNIDKVETDKLF